MACIAKLKVMNSTIGRRPTKAAPTPRPAKPCSVIGVSTTRSAPNSKQSLGDFVGPLVLGDLFAHHKDIVVATHLLRHRVAQRLAYGHHHHLRALRDVGISENRFLRRSRCRG